MPKTIRAEPKSGWRITKTKMAATRQAETRIFLKLGPVIFLRKSEKILAKNIIKKIL